MLFNSLINEHTHTGRIYRTSFGKKRDTTQNLGTSLNKKSHNAKMSCVLRTDMTSLSNQTNAHLEKLFARRFHIAETRYMKSSSKQF